MELIVTLLVGALVGWLASIVVDGRHSPVVPNVLLGIVGAAAGDWIAGALGLAVVGTPARWLVSLIAAILLIGLVRALGGLRPRVRPV